MAGSACRRLLFLFTLLSLADLGMTWVLLQRAGRHARESNPIAAWWLTHFGWSGLAGFKGVLVLVVVVLVVVVSRYRPRTGGRLLKFACSTLLAVVLYSGYLLGCVEAEAAAPGNAERQRVELRAEALEQQMSHLRAYRVLVDGLCADLVARRRTLAEAVEVLADSEYVREPAWLKSRWVFFGDMSTKEWLATRLVAHALSPLEGDRGRWEPVARDLAEQFRSCFGHPGSFGVPRPAGRASQGREGRGWGAAALPSL